MPTPLDFTSFIKNAYAAYGCNRFGDDTAGNRIWENSDSSLDLTKGDGSTASTFPTFTSNAGHNVEYYAFDGVDDYVSDWPSMPDTYTVVAAFSDSYPDGQPYITKCNDTTIEDLLTVPGGFTGNLHSLIIFDRALSPLEEFYVEQVMLRRVWLKTFVDPFTARLIRDGSCELCLYCEEETDRFVDYANALGSTDYSTVFDAGLTFPTASAALEMDASGDLNLDALTMFLEAPDFDTNCLTSETVLQNGTNYLVTLSNGSESLQFGQDNTGSAGSPAANFHLYSEFACSADAWMTSFLVYATASRTIKLNVYIKNGSAYYLLWANDTGVAVVAGWNTIDIATPIQLLSGESYALCFIANGTMSSTTALSGKTSGYKLLTYSTFTAPSSFDPTADGYTQKTDFNLRVKAYGYLTGNQTCILGIGGTTYSFTKGPYRTLGISAVDGEKALVYLNGEYSGQTASTVTISSGGGNQLYIGNNALRDNPLSSTLKKLSIYSDILSAEEVRAAHRMALAERPFS